MGAGEVERCPEKETTYELRVVLRDGTETYRRLTIEVDGVPSDNKNEKDDDKPKDDDDDDQPTAPVVIMTAVPARFPIGECTTVNWTVEGSNIQEVYYEGELVSNPGSKRECPDAETTLELKVKTSHGTYTYTVQVEIADS